MAVATNRKFDVGANMTMELQTFHDDKPLSTHEVPQDMADCRRVERALRYGSRATKRSIRRLLREGWSDWNIIDRLHRVEGLKC